jgi:membrane-associated phospholipid phosphatase
MKVNVYFIIGFFIYLLIGAIILLNFEKGEFELWLNQRHQVGADIFFKYFTHIGDGIFFLGVIVVLWVYNRLKAILGLLVFITTGLTSQALKLLVFPGVPRPKAFFGEKYALHFVEGVEIHLSNSFPSGHSITAFAVFFLLSLLVKNKLWGILFIILAIFGAFSRVYLLQHFFVDTYFGALIGVVITALIGLIWNFYALNSKSGYRKK